MLMEDMQGEFRSGPFDPKQWKKGTPVAAKYSVRFFITNSTPLGGRKGIGRTIILCH